MNRTQNFSRPGLAFWTAAIGFATMMSFTTVPTPLYSLYQARDGFPTVAITAIFAAYAFGVMLSLYLFGHVSDWTGRKRVTIISAVVAILAAVLFLTWSTLPGLLVARFVSGLGVGAFTSTMTAYLVEIRQRQAPDRLALATTVGGVANLGGLALGPLIGGVFAEWVPRPLVSPYALYLVLLVLCLVAFAALPETVSRRNVRWHPQRVEVPSAHRAIYWASGICAFASFAITGFYGSVAPGFLSTVLHQPDRFLAGFASFAVFGAAALSQVVFARLALRNQIILGTVLIAVGLVGVALGGPIGSIWVFVVGGVLGGAGMGLVFRGSLATASAIAPADRRSAVLAGVFLMAYAGLSVAPLLLGIALVWLPIIPVTIGFAVAVFVLVLWSGSLMIRRAA